MENFIYDGSLEGFLTSIFVGYEQNRFCLNIINSKQSFNDTLQNYTQINTSLDKAKRVKNGIIKKVGKKAYQEICTVFCSDQKNKENILFEYLKLIFAFGLKARLMLNNPSVVNYNYLLKKVIYERHYAISKLEFKETSAGLMYARYSPTSDITGLLLEHFVNRLNSKNFIIHDTKRNIVGVYNKQENRFFTYQNPSRALYT